MMKKYLNLGCGNKLYKGAEWVNIDFASEVADMRLDLRLPLPFESNSVDFIFASHLIEHFTPYEWCVVVKDWYRVLRSGSCVEVRVPDMEVACREWLSGNRYSGEISAHGMIFGTQEVIGQMHHQGFDKAKLRDDLEHEGFTVFYMENEHPSWQIICKAQK